MEYLAKSKTASGHFSIRNITTKFITIDYRFWWTLFVEKFHKTYENDKLFQTNALNPSVLT